MHEIMEVGVSVATMQVVFFAVHYVHDCIVIVQASLPFIRISTRPYRDRLTAPSQLKLAEYFPSWVFPIFLNPIKLKNKYYWFFVHTRGYKLQFDYDHLLITMLH